MIFVEIDLNFIIGCVTVLISLISILLTYRSTKKIKFYETLFAKKAESYERFIRLTDDYTRRNWNVVELTNAMKICSLYASPSVERVLMKYFLALQEIHSANKLDASYVTIEMIEKTAETRLDAINVMRKDIRRCRRFKFD